MEPDLAAMMLDSLGVTVGDLQSSGAEPMTWDRSKPLARIFTGSRNAYSKLKSFAQRVPACRNNRLACAEI
jgi:hypothetical protein